MKTEFNLYKVDIIDRMLLVFVATFIVSLINWVIL